MLSETGNVRRTDFRFMRRVTVMRDDLHKGRVSRRVIYRLTFMFTYRKARFIALKEALALFYVFTLSFFDFCWIFFLEDVQIYFCLEINLCIKDRCNNIGDILIRCMRALR